MGVPHVTGRLNRSWELVALARCIPWAVPGRVLLLRATVLYRVLIDGEAAASGAAACAVHK